MEQFVVPAIIVLLLLAFWLMRRPDLSSSRARELVASGAALIDVRSAGEFSMGHINGAKNIPVDQISARASELKKLNKPIVVYCASGMRSSMAARTLKSAGCTEVYNLGAMARW